MDHWDILETKIAHKNDWVMLRQDTCRLPDGRLVHDYNVLVEYDVACVVGLTTDRRLLICEQYKHGIRDITFEIPGGMFSSADADPLAEARREFVEETGYDAPEYFMVSALPISPARLAQRMYVYAAPNAFRVGDQQLDDNEAIRVHLLTLDEVHAMLRDGRICASTSVAGIYLCLDYLRRAGFLD